MINTKTFIPVLATLIASCKLGDYNSQHDIVTKSDVGSVLLQVSLIYAPENVERIEAYLITPDAELLSGVTKTMVHSAQVEFSDIASGFYDLEVDWKDNDDNVIRSKRVGLNVSPASTIQVSMQNQELTDSIETIIAREDSSNCTFGEEFILDVYEDNPIIPRDSSWNYASVVGPAVVVDDGIYYMWYTGRGNTPFQVGLATSQDGVFWEEYTGNPVLTLGEDDAFDNGEIRWPTVIKDEDIFKMWYTGLNVVNNTWSIGYATSTDGIRWTKYEYNPVLTVSDIGWDSYLIRLGSVLRVEDHFFMWYDGMSSADGVLQIGVAFSPDGINWVKSSFNPILRPGNELFESERVDVTNVRIMENGTFEMLYTGMDIMGRRSTGRAISDDGIFWIQDPLNPIIPHAGTNNWNEYSSAGAVFIRNGNQYQFWFSGNGGYDSNWNIGTAKGWLICE